MVALGSARTLEKRVPGIFPRGGGGGSKCGRYVGLTNLLPSCADCLEIWEPHPPGQLRVCPGPQAYRDFFTFTDEEAPHYALFFVPLLPCSSLTMKKEKSDLANRKEDG